MRVTDAGSPLCGWDLLCEIVEGTGWADVHAARRLDVLLGDRPLQYTPPDGLGMTIDLKRVSESPLQEEGPIEIAVDSEGLYGEHLESREYTHESDDGTTADMTVEIFTAATQVAFRYTEGEDEYTCSKTWFGDTDGRTLERLVGLLKLGDIAGVLEMIEGGEDGRAKA